MAHVRRQIRDAIYTALDAVPGMTGIVSKNRIFTQQSAPAIIIYTGEEDAEQLTIGRPIISSRNMAVNIEVISKAGEGLVDNQIDQYSELIESALGKDLNVPAKNWFYTGMTMTASKDGEKAAASARFEWVFIYHVKEGDPAIGV